MKLDKLFRPNILSLKPYSCARDEYDGGSAIFLDANESPYQNGCNRYPDPRQRLLKRRIGELYGVRTQQMILGNGSDEVIDILIRSTCRPAEDNIVVFVPGYSMYEVSAAVNDVEVRRISLTADFLPDEDALWKTVDERTKLIFLCTPNNPVGNLVPIEAVERIARRFEGLVVVDEAYIDFADAPSAVTLLDARDNIFVLRTLSKSWGMAGLRIGMGIGSAEFVAVLDRVKPPYNIGGPAQEMALGQLQDTEGFARRIAEIKGERERMQGKLSEMGIFTKIYPSQANFLLVTTPRHAELYDFLAKNGVVVRVRDIPPLIAGGLRISVGTPEENDHLIKMLEIWKNTSL